MLFHSLRCWPNIKPTSDLDRYIQCVNRVSGRRRVTSTGDIISIWRLRQRKWTPGGVELLRLCRNIWGHRSKQQGPPAEDSSASQANDPGSPVRPLSDRAGPPRVHAHRVLSRGESGSDPGGGGVICSQSRSVRRGHSHPLSLGGKNHRRSESWSSRCHPLATGGSTTLLLIIKTLNIFHIKHWDQGVFPI